MASSWEQTSPTTFEHTRSVFEQLYFFTQGPFGEPAPWTLFSTTKFKSPSALANHEIKASLRKAWADTRATAPQIAGRHGQSTKIVEVLEGQSLENWLLETFITLEDKTPDDVFQECASRPYMTLFYFPKRRELTLQANHAFIDGRGCMFFWDSFFSILATPSQIRTLVTVEKVRKVLPPSLESILGVPETTSTNAEAAAQRTLERGMTENPILIPVKDTSAPPKGFLRLQIKLSPEQSSKVIAACKGKEITVTSAVHVAVGLAVQEHQLKVQGKAGDTWAGYTNIDARRYFGDSYSKDLSRIACHFTVMPFRVPIKPNTFDKTTADLSDYYRKALDHPLAGGSLDALPAILPLYLKATAEGASFTKTPWLTTLGIVDNFTRSTFGSWEIEDFWLANSIQGPFVQFLLWTWKGQVVLGGAWNEAFYDVDVVEKILKRSEQVLLEYLGIQ